VNRRLPLLALLFAASGFAGLVYEVLWLRGLGLLFGNTVLAASTTLAAFFLGLAVGAWRWGKRSARLDRPLRTYAVLEVAIAASVLPYFLLLPAYRAFYEPIYSALGGWPSGLTAVQFLAASAVLFPPAFFMGGTLPVVGQYLVRRSDQLGRTGSLLYALNTAGAAAGALCAGFYLPSALGYRASFGLAMAVNVAVAAVAYVIDRADPPAKPAKPTKAKKSRRPSATPFSATFPVPLPLLAFLSGFLTLGLEVLWTRMFSQVMQNSVYTFSAILVVFLAVLSLGGLLANLLARRKASTSTTLSTLLALAGIAAAASPFLFMDATDGMRYIGSGMPWPAYVTAVFVKVTLVLLVPGILAGAVFPYLAKAAESLADADAGPVLGSLAAWNTLGAVAGSVSAGFLVLPTVGLWAGLRLFGLAYLLVAGAMLARAQRTSWTAAAVPAVGLLLVITALDATRLPLVRVVNDDERLLETWQGSHGVVAVAERPSGLRIKVNNFYRLGGSAAAEHERNQALIPLMAHPDPKEVFFLGMGTGITAGAALSQPVDEIVVAELVPEVIDAAAKYFNDFSGGLFSDPRARVLAADGRNHLAGSSRRYDAIIGDLFIPWKQGSGSLYSLEHFRAVSRRLKPGGVFMQWLPLYQVSEEEFRIIARTLLEAFPEVVLWRGDFYANKPILGLMASNEPLELDPAAIVARGRRMSGRPDLPAFAVEAVTIPFYAGNLGRSRSVLGDGPINTDDRPVIEYGSPRSHRTARSAGNEDGWFTGAPLARLFARLAEETPLTEDPYLARLTSEQRGYVLAGRLYYERAVAKSEGDEALAEQRLAQFHLLIPTEFRPETAAADEGSAILE